MRKRDRREGKEKGKRGHRERGGKGGGMIPPWAFPGSFRVGETDYEHACLGVRPVCSLALGDK